MRICGFVNDRMVGEYIKAHYDLGAPVTRVTSTELGDQWLLRPLSGEKMSDRRQDFELLQRYARRSLDRRLWT